MELGRQRVGLVTGLLHCCVGKTRLAGRLPLNHIRCVNARLNSGGGGAWIRLFGGILVALLAVTTYASLDRSVFDVGPQLTSDPWFHATLADAYFGFLTFYVWVAYQESGLWRKLPWFVLIMTLGNIAMSV